MPTSLFLNYLVFFLTFNLFFFTTKKTSIKAASDIQNKSNMALLYPCIKAFLNRGKISFASTVVNWLKISLAWSSSDNKLLIKCCWLYESCTFVERSFWIEGRAVFTMVKSINPIKPNRLTPISAHHFLFVFVDRMPSLGNLSLLMIHMAQKQCQVILQFVVYWLRLNGCPTAKPF